MSVQDKQLADNIRDVFDSFEDQSSERGWAELRKKYPEKNNRKFVFWLNGVALLALVGLGIWYYSWAPESGPKARTRTKIGRVDSLPLQSQSTPEIGMTDSKNVNFEREIVKKPAGVLELNSTQQNAPSTISTNEMDKPVPLPRSTEISDATSQAGSTLAAKPPIKMKENSEEPARIEPVNSGSSSVNVVIDTVALRDKYLDKGSSTSLLPDTTFKADSTRRRLEQQIKKKGEFSVYVSGYYNFTSDGPGTYNAGAGVGYELPVFAKLRLSPGIALRPAHFHFDGDIPSTYSDKVSLPQQSSVSTNGNGNINSVDARLLALDIPLNLAYQFRSNSQMSLAAGISSYIFLSERYAYNVFDPAQTPVVRTSLQKFNGTNIAASLNLLSSFVLRLNGSEGISVEPFIKIPLRGLGKKNILFGYGGVNLKLIIPSAVQR
ncbi:MAG: hypothetical protein K0S09_593 [Sphingobacteriaceae bacterium]|jgi:hypothetical protein|nr:hypothetical protein [Sphingobacteriaceae bacterium]